MQAFEDVPMYNPDDLVHGLLASHCADETGTVAGQCLVKDGDKVKFSPGYLLTDIFQREQGVDIN
jgi:hypothetical protein